ncbi:Gfo/Idh/MocA family oxidoreductase [Candidatus Woesearchaeota archaeon]|nr:Gfo/Idh/MocA family oxidoreductase [Candidatus Woesearchaeota archaeon]MBT5397265.1 Gfo/Idh/MocA family oxidoreductase [Candidatus Woesearchaeota archaeon]MBT6367189.1 Gfo/Idh/MocA family oxidoreductase [Candidatus Woesearchaeota archaeon]MBT7762665.1 Gfo/Idh/MocA family oxidoreductase [Candidatus Woesearchaeota archaeon]
MRRVGVIGVGLMGRNHARVYADLENVELVAISDPDEVALTKQANRFGCTKYTNYQDMIEKEKLDIVSIAVPTSLHKQVSFNVIAKGINVLLEKPIAPTIQEAKDIIEFAREKNVKLMIGHIERFNPAIIELKKRLDNNELGKIFKIDVSRVGPYTKRMNDVGVVVDLAVHDLDIIRYITGSEVITTHSITKKHIHAVHEDLVNAILTLKNGTICTLNVNRLTPTRIRKMYVTGEKGMFVIDYITQNFYFYENTHGITYTDFIRDVSEGRMTKFFIEKKEPLKAEIEHFVDVVNNNKMPLITGDDGLKAIQLAHQLLSKEEVKMKNVLIVGFGEIGKSMYNVIDETKKFTLFKKDVEPLELHQEIDVMHVCVPFFDNFVDIVSEYINQYKPKLTIINSTVQPGITNQIFAKTNALIVHSPVRGRHPNLEGGIKRFIKFIGPTTEEAGKRAKEHFDECNVTSEVLTSATNTELGKLLSTTYYAANIAFHQEMNRICGHFGAEFTESVTRFNETCTMDIDHKIPRPVMFPGVIGGHCLMPNIEILRKNVSSNFLNQIVDSNDKRKEEVEKEKKDDTKTYTCS